MTCTPPDAAVGGGNDTGEGVEAEFALGASAVVEIGAIGDDDRM